MNDCYRSLRFLFLKCLPILLLNGCDQPPEQGYQGYVEGDYMYLAAPRSGYLKSLAVDRGIHVTTGQSLFVVDDAPERYEMDEASKQMVSAQERVIDLQQPHRQPEIAMMEAQLKAMEANLQFAELQLQRMDALVGKGFAAKEARDQAQADRDQSFAQVEAAREQLAVYRINLGRDAEIGSAEAELQAARARVEQKRWQLEIKFVTAPTEGEVTEIYYRPGEWVPAAQPVISFLPDTRRRIRFFIAETDLAGIQLGQRVKADCDGCKTAINATVTFIAAKAEYTPPVIYSRKERAKLVFRVEAEPAPEDAIRLHPGLPMNIRVLRTSP